MNQNDLVEYLADSDDLETGSVLSEKQAVAREVQRMVFETIVTEAVELVEYCNIDPFDAADWAATTHNYDEFETVLTAVRAEVNHP